MVTTIVLRNATLIWSLITDDTSLGKLRLFAEYKVRVLTRDAWPGLARLSVPPKCTPASVGSRVSVAASDAFGGEEHEAEPESRAGIDSTTLRHLSAVR